MTVTTETKMKRTRRELLRTAGVAIGAGTLATGASGTATAADRPAMTVDPAHYSNYSSANRGPSDVRWITIHTIEGSASAGINWFKNPDANVSSHYVIDADGGITKMVEPSDIAWTNGNSGYNRTGINVELAGYAGATQFSDALYESLADLVAYLAETYDLPTRHPTYDLAPCSAYGGDGGVIGHAQIPSPYDCSRVTGGKTDPGSTFDWGYLLELVDGSDRAVGDVVATTTAANVRSAPAVGDNVRFTNPEGTRGVIKDGPETADGYDWWRVVYENGVAGWTADSTLGAAGVTFLHDQRVATTADLVVHTDPALDAPSVWTAPEGAAGYVRSGPRQADDYLWWEVAFNDGDTGWCVERYLDAAPVAGNGLTPDESEPAPTFSDGDPVRATTTLNTRERPGSDEAVVETVGEGAPAEVVNGPVDADGYTWWGLHWTDANVWGWSVERYLDAR